VGGARSLGLALKGKTAIAAGEGEYSGGIREDCAEWSDPPSEMKGNGGSGIRNTGGREEDVLLREWGRQAD